MGLERIRATEAQFGLSALGREQNLAMAFKLGSGFRREVPAKPILLLDDIYTTGATARSYCPNIASRWNSGVWISGDRSRFLNPTATAHARLKNLYASYLSDLYNI